MENLDSFLYLLNNADLDVKLQFCSRLSSKPQCNHRSVSFWGEFSSDLMRFKCIILLLMHLQNFISAFSNQFYDKKLN